MRFFLSAILVLAISVWTRAQSPDLYAQLFTADSLLFEEGFNRCNFDALDSLIHPDLVFLHDQSGRQNREDFFRAVRENICSNPEFKPIRKLEPGTLEVYPLYNNGVLYGAVQMGRHEFYIAEPGKPLQFTSRARFVHTWLLENERRLLKDVLSFDHRQ